MTSRPEVHQNQISVTSGRSASVLIWEINAGVREKQNREVNDLLSRLQVLLAHHGAVGQRQLVRRASRRLHRLRHREGGGVGWRGQIKDEEEGRGGKISLRQLKVRLCSPSFPTNFISINLQTPYFINMTAHSVGHILRCFYHSI